MATNDYIYNYFLGQGWSPVASAGITGNIMAESGGNIRAIGDGGSAFGLAQWHPDRQRNFKKLFGNDIRQSTIDQQLQFIHWELNNTESRAGNMLRNAQTVNQATGVVMNQYERPADDSSFSRRLREAGKVLGQGNDILQGGANVLKGMGIELPDFGGGGVSGGVGLPKGSGSPASSDECGSVDFICKLRKWLDESQFWQRLGIGVVALILLLMTFYLLGAQKNINLKGLANA